MARPSSTRPKPAPKPSPQSRAKPKLTIEYEDTGFDPILRDKTGQFLQKDAAAIIGTTTRSMENWRKRNDCTVFKQGGTVDMPRMIQWLIDRETGPLKARLEEMDGSDDKESMRKYQLRSMRTANVLQDITVKERLGELVPKKALFHQASTILSDVASRFKPLGVKLGPILSANHDETKCTQLLDQAIDKILRELTSEIVFEMGAREIDPFFQADLEAAEAQREADREEMNESAA